MSLLRTINHIRSAGLKKFWRDLQYIGDAKAGTLVGQDVNGNKFYENLNEIPADIDGWITRSTITTLLRSSLSGTLGYITFAPRLLTRIPSSRPVEERGKLTTGSRAAFRTYDTVKKKINSWEPTVADRK